MTEASRIAFGCVKIWVITSLPRFDSLAALVTMMPAAVEVRRAGIWLTRPSPMVKMV